MAKYRKKPVVIEAVQFDGSNKAELLEWMKAGNAWVEDGAALVIVTLEGDMTAQPGDWIIKGVRGEFYPCKPDIFAATYDLVEGDQL